MQKLNDLENWRQVEARQSINLPANKRRRVRLHFNSPEPVALYIADASGKADRFLARVCGLDTVEFYASGALAIIPDGVVQYCTTEGEKTHIENAGKEAFTKIHERRARNHELELMAYMARENQRRMDETLQQNREVLDELRRVQGGDKPKGDNGDAGKPPAKPADASAGGTAKPAAKSGGGDADENAGGD